ncbi:hypothetical protein D3C87_1527360 [compost metagenome]
MNGAAPAPIPAATAATDRKAGYRHGARGGSIASRPMRAYPITKRPIVASAIAVRTALAGGNRKTSAIAMTAETIETIASHPRLVSIAPHSSTRRGARAAQATRMPGSTGR